MNLTKTRFMFLAVTAVVFCLAHSVNAQQIPAGVRYKKTSDEINQKAKSILESALTAKADDVNLEAISDGAIACGPLLWDALKDQAGKELQEAKLMLVVIGGAKPLTKEGRGIVTPEQKSAFWKLFVEKIKAKNSFTVRKAEAPEIQYYWATIPFDIEEPLYIVDFGKVKVLFNFTMKNSEPKISWMDIVGDLAMFK